MKKFMAIALSAAMIASLAGCASVVDQAVDEANAQISSAAEEAGEAIESAQSDIESAASDISEEAESIASDVSEELTDVAVMSYAEYEAAAINDPVCIDAYVQAKQSWWDNSATVYLQDEDGAYFVYGMACTEEEYETLVPGQEIIVTGFKAEWEGEIEISDATFVLGEGNFIAEATDVTDLLGTDELIDHQNQFVSFSDMTVEASTDADGNEVAFLYNWDGSGAQGDDLYFNVSSNGETYTFTVESYLTDSSTDVYAAVEGLSIGDTVDLEGFLYWYQGVNPHITSVTVK